MQVIQQSWSSPLQTCSDRLHMPGNLEFISPPFLISAPVIQINSNEISRGKAPFGWGVCSSLQLSPVRRPSSPSEGPNNPPPPLMAPPFKVGPLQHVEERIWGAVTHRRGASSVCASRGSGRFCVKKKKRQKLSARLPSTFLLRGGGTHRGRDKTETTFDKWTNSRGISFYSQHVCGGL